MPYISEILFAFVNLKRIGSRLRVIVAKLSADHNLKNTNAKVGRANGVVSDTIDTLRAYANLNRLRRKDDWDDHLSFASGHGTTAGERKVWPRRHAT